MRSFEQHPTACPQKKGRQANKTWDLWRKASMGEDGGGGGGSSLSEGDYKEPSLITPCLQHSLPAGVTGVP